MSEKKKIADAFELESAGSISKIQVVDKTSEKVNVEAEIGAVIVDGSASKAAIYGDGDLVVKGYAGTGSVKSVAGVEITKETTSITEASVVIEDNLNAKLVAGAQVAIDGKVEISDTDVTNVAIAKTDVTVLDAKATDVFAGAVTTATAADKKYAVEIIPTVAEAEVTIMGGTVTNVYGGGTGLAQTGNATINISGGKVSNVYAGGANGGDVYGDVAINIDMNSVTGVSAMNIGTVYAGGNNASIFGNVTIAVTTNGAEGWSGKIGTINGAPAKGGIVAGNKILELVDYQGEFAAAVKNMGKVIISGDSAVNFTKAQDKSMKNAEYIISVDSADSEYNQAALLTVKSAYEFNKLTVLVEDVESAFSRALIAGNKSSFNSSKFDVDQINVKNNNGGIVADYQYELAFETVTDAKGKESETGKLIFTYTGAELVVSVDGYENRHGIKNVLSGADDVVTFRATYDSLLNNTFRELAFDFNTNGGDDTVTIESGVYMSGKLSLGAGSDKLTINGNLNGLDLAGENEIIINGVLNAENISVTDDSVNKFVLNGRFAESKIAARPTPNLNLYRDVVFYYEDGTSTKGGIDPKKKIMYAEVTRTVQVGGSESVQTNTTKIPYDPNNALFGGGVGNAARPDDSYWIGLNDTIQGTGAGNLYSNQDLAIMNGSNTVVVNNNTVGNITLGGEYGEVVLNVGITGGIDLSKAKTSVLVIDNRAANYGVNYRGSAVKDGVSKIYINEDFTVASGETIDLDNANLQGEGGLWIGDGARLTLNQTYTEGAIKIEDINFGINASIDNNGQIVYGNFSGFYNGAAVIMWEVADSDITVNGNSTFGKVEGTSFTLVVPPATIPPTPPSAAIFDGSLGKGNTQQIDSIAANGQNVTFQNGAEAVVDAVENAFGTLAVTNSALTINDEVTATTINATDAALTINDEVDAITINATRAVVTLNKELDVTTTLGGGSIVLDDAVLNIGENSRANALTLNGGSVVVGMAPAIEADEEGEVVPPAELPKLTVGALTVGGEYEFNDATFAAIEFNGAAITLAAGSKISGTTAYAVAVNNNTLDDVTFADGFKAAALTANNGSTVSFNEGAAVEFGEITAHNATFTAGDDNGDGESDAVTIKVGGAEHADINLPDIPGVPPALDTPGSLTLNGNYVLDSDKDVICVDNGSITVNNSLIVADGKALQFFGGSITAANDATLGGNFEADVAAGGNLTLVDGTRIFCTEEPAHGTIRFTADGTLKTAGTATVGQIDIANKTVTVLGTYNTTIVGAAGSTLVLGDAFGHTNHDGGVAGATINFTAYNNAEKAIDLLGNMRVDKASTVTGDVDVAGTLTLNDSLTVNGELEAGALTVAKNATVTAITVTGQVDVTTGAQLTMAGDLTAASFGDGALSRIDFAGHKLVTTADAASVSLNAAVSADIVLEKNATINVTGAASAKSVTANEDLTVSFNEGTAKDEKGETIKDKNGNDISFADFASNITFGADKDGDSVNTLRVGLQTLDPPASIDDVEDDAATIGDVAFGAAVDKDGNAGFDTFDAQVNVKAGKITGEAVEFKADADRAIAANVEVTTVKLGSNVTFKDYNADKTFTADTIDLAGNTLTAKVIYRDADGKDIKNGDNKQYVNDTIAVKTLIGGGTVKADIAGDVKLAWTEKENAEPDTYDYTIAGNVAGAVDATQAKSLTGGAIDSVKDAKKNDVNFITTIAGGVKYQELTVGGAFVADFNGAETAGKVDAVGDHVDAGGPVTAPQVDGFLGTTLTVADGTVINGTVTTGSGADKVEVTAGVNGADIAAINFGKAYTDANQKDKFDKLSGAVDTFGVDFANNLEIEEGDIDRKAFIADVVDTINKQVLELKDAGKDIVLSYDKYGIKFGIAYGYVDDTLEGAEKFDPSNIKVTIVGLGAALEGNDEANTLKVTGETPTTTTTVQGGIDLKAGDDVLDLDAKLTVEADNYNVGGAGGDKGFYAEVTPGTLGWTGKENAKFDESNKIDFGAGADKIAIGKDDVVLTVGKILFSDTLAILNDYDAKTKTYAEGKLTLNGDIDAAGKTLTIGADVTVDGKINANIEFAANGALKTTAETEVAGKITLTSELVYTAADPKADPAIPAKAEFIGSDVVGNINAGKALEIVKVVTKTGDKNGEDAGADKAAVGSITGITEEDAEKKPVKVSNVVLSGAAVADPLDDNETAGSVLAVGDVSELASLTINNGVSASAVSGVDKLILNDKAELTIAAGSFSFSKMEVEGKGAVKTNTLTGSAEDDKLVLSGDALKEVAVAFGAGKDVLELKAAATVDSITATGALKITGTGALTGNVNAGTALEITGVTFAVGSGVTMGKALEFSGTISSTLTATDGTADVLTLTGAATIATIAKVETLDLDAFADATIGTGAGTIQKLDLSDVMDLFTDDTIANYNEKSFKVTFGEAITAQYTTDDGAHYNALGDDITLTTMAGYNVKLDLSDDTKSVTIAVVKA